MGGLRVVTGERERERERGRENNTSLSNSRNVYINFITAHILLFIMAQKFQFTMQSHEQLIGDCQHCWSSEINSHQSVKLVN